MTSDKLIYVAVPYGHPDESVKLARVQDAKEYCARMIKAGHNVISPLIFGLALLSVFAGDDLWKTWDKFCLSILHRCNELHVLTVHGWKESKGVQAEIQKAKDLGIQVYLVDINSGPADKKTLLRDEEDFVSLTETAV